MKKDEGHKIISWSSGHTSNVQMIMVTITWDSQNTQKSAACWCNVASSYWCAGRHHWFSARRFGVWNQWGFRELLNLHPGPRHFLKMSMWSVDTAAGLNIENTSHCPTPMWSLKIRSASDLKKQILTSKQEIFQDVYLPWKTFDVAVLHIKSNNLKRVKFTRYTNNETHMTQLSDPFPVNWRPSSSKMMLYNSLHSCFVIQFVSAFPRNKKKISSRRVWDKECQFITTLPVHLCLGTHERIKKVYLKIFMSHLKLSCCYSCLVYRGQTCWLYNWNQFPAQPGKTKYISQFLL